jgi:inner membrane protein
MTDSVPERAGPWGNGRGTVGFWRSPATKFFLAGALTLALVIPLWMVLALTADRSSRRDEVVGSIGHEWGGAQSVGGPILVIPFLATVAAPDDGRPTQHVRHLAVLPETLDIDSETEAERRSVAVYDVPVYLAKVAAKGRFAPVDAAAFGSDAGTIFWDRAYLAVGISDLSGVEEAALTAANAELAIDPRFAPDGAFVGSGSSAPGWTGVHARLSPDLARSGFVFALDLSLRGTASLKFTPLGRQSTVTGRSNWAHPNFAVGMLPSEREVSRDGFTATWRVPYLARTQSQISVLEDWGPSGLYSDAVGVGLVEPVDLYGLMERALKYGVMFIGVTFMTVFLLEVLSPRRIHIVQYCLVGLELLMFFVLLLALAERIGFGAAYASAAGATGLVVSAFVGVALESVRKAAIAAVSFAVTFGLLYAVLTLEDFALLAGAIVGFLALSAVLFATRKVDWSGTGRSPQPAIANSVP